MITPLLYCLLLISLPACTPNIKVCVEDMTGSVEAVTFRSCGQNYVMRKEQDRHWTIDTFAKLTCESVAQLYASTAENTYNVGGQYLSNAPIGDSSYSFYLAFDEVDYRDSDEKVLKVKYRQHGELEKQETCTIQNQRLWKVIQRKQMKEKPQTNEIWGTKN